ncbi:MAG: hypothetical protein H0W62_03550 [Chitinophagales bacterium]|nr:hypothetical protein [Chitinophagales bacterium]
MKKIVLSVALLIFSLDAFAQLTGNEWISFQQSYFKFKIINDGFYHLDYETLVKFGVPLTTITGNEFQIFSRGAEIPVYATAEGAFATNDYIEFYARHNDGSLDSSLYLDKSWQANERLSMFNDTACYYLTWNSQPNHLRFDTIADNLLNHPQKESYCWYISGDTFGRDRAPANYGIGPTTYTGQAVYESDFNTTEGYTDAAFNKSQISYALSTPYLYVAGPPAVFNAYAVAAGLTNHVLSISINGNTLYTGNSFGFVTQEIKASLPSNSWLTDNTAVTYSNAASTEVTDYNSVAWQELKYPRQFNAGNSSSFLFNVNGGPSNKYIEIVNFDERGAEPVLFDFTNHLRMEAIVQNDTEKFVLPASISERQLLLISEDTSEVIKKVDSLFSVQFTDFSIPLNQGNFIIITHPFFFNDGTGHNYINDYRDFKNSYGYKSIVVDVNQLYDQFAYGIRLHPLAIRNFADYILSKWPPDERHLFLIGKGIEYTSIWSNSVNRSLCYVPTFGNPGSDNLLTATNASPVPRIPIGRISCLSANEIRIYLDKAKLFMSAQSIPFQTIENMAWMKNVVHLAGGLNAAEQSVYEYFLNKYKLIIQDTLYGGHVFSFFKSSSSPIQYVTSTYVDSILKSGVSMITFFGHSSYNSFDFNLDKPDQYDNYGKYPFMLTNGCLIGNLFTSTHGISENFIFEEGKAAIGFLAPSQFSLSTSLDLYSTNFYQNLSVKNYNKSVGTVIAGTIQNIAAQSTSSTDKAVAEQMLLDCDPSLKLNTHAKPDYVIEAQSVSFDPPTISAGLDSFHLKIIITNIGEAINDSIYIDVHRKLSNGDEEFLYHYRIKAPYYTDTVSLMVKTESSLSLGINQFDIKVDAGDSISATGEIEELSEINNEITVPLLILTDDILPVYPYEYSIVNSQGVILKASTVNPFAGIKQYVIQIDTTENFNSLQLHTIKISQKGGVIKWAPATLLQDSVVYYWRTSLDTLYGNHLSWHTSSFTHINGSATGWSQSHYFQFLKDPLVNVQLGSNRVFSFVSDVKTVSAFDGVTTWIGGPLSLDQPAYYINGVLMARWDCGGYGTSVLFAVIDSATGIQWMNPNLGGTTGLYGSIQCKPNPRNMFLYNTLSAENLDVIHFLDTIPNGDYILMMTINDANIRNWDATMLNAFTKLGLTKITSIDSIVPYVFFLKKNDFRYPVYEVVGDTFTSILNPSFVITGHWDQGSIESPLIGPAKSWSSLHWKAHELENGKDHISLQLIGVNSEGIETILSNNIIANDTVLTAINSLLYPFLKLRLNTLDTSQRTPVQLDEWQVYYQPVPEAALNPSAYFSFKDTAQQFIPQNLTVAVENLSPWNMDSLLMKYEITDISNAKHLFYKRYKPLPANDTIHVSYSFDTGCDCYAGLNYLYAEANPDNDQPEQTHFNNFGVVKYSLSRDRENPLLDVTFDGMHILDGDLISAKPDIEIMLKDENKFLALNDTSLFKLYFIYPDGSNHAVTFDNTSAIFFPANQDQLAKNNTARISVLKSFPVDGKYQLVVQGFDRSGNASGSNSYKISFEVINAAMISNVLNYPNPFSTSTQFVFTLTGSIVPQSLKIEIMTITGRVVKEIFMNELGHIHIGNNITDYTWNGTDQYGDKLANGLYFYRVTAILNGKSLDHYGSSTDSYFKKGIGKMYLMR